VDECTPLPGGRRNRIPALSAALPAASAAICRGGELFGQMTILSGVVSREVTIVMWMIPGRALWSIGHIEWYCGQVR